MKPEEIREKRTKENKRVLREKRMLARKLRFEIVSRQTKEHRDYRKTKKDIARILTILKEGDKKVKVAKKEIKNNINH